MFHVKIVIFQDGHVTMNFMASIPYDWAQDLTVFGIYDEVFMVVM